MAVRPAVLDNNVPAFDIAAFAQTLPETIKEPRCWVGRRAIEKPDHRHRGALRARAKRPRQRGPGKRDESGSSIELQQIRFLALFNQLIGPHKQAERDLESERPRGFAVDHQLELGGHLYWKITGLLAV